MWVLIINRSALYMEKYGNKQNKDRLIDRQQADISVRKLMGRGISEKEKGRTHGLGQQCDDYGQGQGQ